MRLDIRYRLRFEYGSTVSESYNEVRVRPQDTDSQTVASYRLTASPAARPSSAVDYWGTTVSHVGIREAHEVLELVAEAAVDTSEVAAPSGDAELSMLEQLDFRTEHWEFLQPSDHVEWNDAIRELAVDAMEGSASVLEAVDAAAEAANNSVNGPTLVPMLTFGIPGDNITAILLGAFVAVGMRPGPELMVEQGPQVFAILLAMLLANVLFVIVGYLTIPAFARVVRIPKSILMPLTIIFAFAGVFAAAAPASALAGSHHLPSDSDTETPTAMASTRMTSTT